jgi:hypothetical protein
MRTLVALKRPRVGQTEAGKSPSGSGSTRKPSRTKYCIDSSESNFGAGGACQAHSRASWAAAVDILMCRRFAGAEGPPRPGVAKWSPSKRSRRRGGISDELASFSLLVVGSRPNFRLPAAISTIICTKFSTCTKPGLVLNLVSCILKYSITKFIQLCTPTCTRTAVVDLDRL